MIVQLTLLLLTPTDSTTLQAYPLDGGRIYAASLILLFKMNPIKAAKTTAITAMLLSSGMILYAIISFLKSTGGSGLLLGVVGAFVLYNSSELFKSAKNNSLEGHPIFGRECYQNAGGNTTQNEIGDVPAQSDSAAMA